MTAESMPHARGDEPAVTIEAVDGKGVCPTHVGMNRVYPDLIRNVSKYAPRTWG